jgi:hypothetical protein
VFWHIFNCGRVRIVHSLSSDITAVGQKMKMDVIEAPLPLLDPHGTCCKPGLASLTIAMIITPGVACCVPG